MNEYVCMWLLGGGGGFGIGIGRLGSDETGPLREGGYGKFYLYRG